MGGCAVLGVSRALGMSVVVLCMWAKVPQILALLKHRSAVGLNMTNILLNITMYTLIKLHSSSYSYSYSFVRRYTALACTGIGSALPVTAYGEHVLLAAQGMPTPYPLNSFISSHCAQR